MLVRIRAAAVSAALLLVAGVGAAGSAPAAAASFYNTTSAFCGVYNHACSNDGLTVNNGRTHVRKAQRVLHATIDLGCKSASPDYMSQVFSQDGRDRCKVTFTKPFGGIPFVAVSSRPDTPDITSYSIPAVIEAGPTYVIVETAQMYGGKLKIYHGGFDLFAIEME